LILVQQHLLQGKHLLRHGARLFQRRVAQCLHACSVREGGIELGSGFLALDALLVDGNE